MKASLLPWLAVGLFVLPVTAQAAEGRMGATSTGSVGITVEIPPIAAALSAANTGAVGLWTIEDAHNGLMIQLPSVLDASTASKGATIYGGRDVQFEAKLEANAFAGIEPAEKRFDNGLNRQDFKLNLAAMAYITDPNQSVTFLISAV